MTTIAIRTAAALVLDGRNVTIELLEYFDRVGLTRRLGNARRLRRTADELITELWTDDS